MRPRFLADADFNQKMVTGLRRREPTVDFQTGTGRGHPWAARPRGEELDIGSAIEDLLLIWAASEAEEWHDKIGFVPI